MDPASAYIAVAVHLTFTRANIARGRQGFGETSAARQTESYK